MEVYFGLLRNNTHQQYTEAASAPAHTHLQKSEETIFREYKDKRIDKARIYSRMYDSLFACV